MLNQQQSVNRFIRLSSNEFFRFNDLRPGTSRRPFWFFVSCLAFLWLLLFLTRWALTQQELDIAESVLQLTLATAAFFAIPISALFIRRLSDAQGLSPLVVSLLALRNNGALGTIALSAIGAFVALALLFVWNSAPLITLIVLTVLALLPSQISGQPKLPRTNSPSQFAPPPKLGVPPTGFNPSSQAPPPGPATKNINVSNGNNPPEPSKKLAQRAGFWISVLLFLLVLFAPFQDKVRESVSELFDSPSPEPTPLVIETETPVPTESPTVSPLTSSEPIEEPVDSQSDDVSGGVAVSDDDDDSLIVVPLNGDDADVSNLDPRFRYCTHAIGAGYGPYYYGIDPEYAWYNDRDRDGIVCER